MIRAANYPDQLQGLIDYWSYVKASSQNGALSWNASGCTHPGSGYTTPTGATGSGTVQHNLGCDRDTVGGAPQGSDPANEEIDIAHEWNADRWLGGQLAMPDNTHPLEEVKEIVMVLSCQPLAINNNPITRNPAWAFGNTSRNGTGRRYYGAQGCLEHGAQRGYPVGLASPSSTGSVYKDHNYSARFTVKDNHFNLEDYDTPWVHWTHGFSWDNPVSREVGSDTRLLADGSFAPRSNTGLLFNCWGETDTDADSEPCWVGPVEQNISAEFEDVNSGIRQAEIGLYYGDDDASSSSPSQVVGGQQYPCRGPYDTLGDMEISPLRYRIAEPCKKYRRDNFSVNLDSFPGSASNTDARYVEQRVFDAAGRPNWVNGRDGAATVQQIEASDALDGPSSYYPGYESAGEDPHARGAAARSDGRLNQEDGRTEHRTTRMMWAVLVDKGPPRPRTSESDPCGIKTPVITTQGPEYGPKPDNGDLWVKGTLTIDTDLCDDESGLLFGRMEFSVNGGAYQTLTTPGCNPRPVRAAGEDARFPLQCTFDTTTVNEGDRVKFRMMMQDLAANTGYSEISIEYRVDNTPPELSLTLRPDPAMRQPYRGGPSPNPWLSDQRWTNRVRVIAEWTNQVGPNSSPTVENSETEYKDGFPTTDPCLTLNRTVNMSGGRRTRTGTQVLANRPTENPADCGQGRHTFQATVSDLLNSTTRMTDFRYDSIDPDQPRDMIRSGSTSTGPVMEVDPKIYQTNRSNFFVVYQNGVKFFGFAAVENPAPERASPLFVTKYRVSDDLVEPARGWANCNTPDARCGQQVEPAAIPESTGQFNLKVYHRDEAGNEDDEANQVTTLSYQQACKVDLSGN